MAHAKSASVAAEQLQEHEELFAFAVELAGTLANERVLPRDVTARIEAFALHLDRHFCFEETEGLFGCIRAAFPHLEHRAAELEAEHVRFRGELRHLVDVARALESDAAQRLRVAQEFAAFRARLHNHEQAEHTLLHEAYEHDIGDKD